MFSLKEAYARFVDNVGIENRWMVLAGPGIFLIGCVGVWYLS